MVQLRPYIYYSNKTYTYLLTRRRSPFFPGPKKRDLDATKKTLESEVFHLHPFLETGWMNVQSTRAWLVRNSERRFYLRQTDEAGLHSTECLQCG